MPAFLWLQRDAPSELIRAKETFYSLLARKEFQSALRVDFLHFSICLVHVGGCLISFVPAMLCSVIARGFLVSDEMDLAVTPMEKHSSLLGAPAGAKLFHFGLWKAPKAFCRMIM